MPLLPTGETEKKIPKSTPKSKDSEEYMKLPRLLPPKDFEETNPEDERLHRIKIILVLIIFIVFIIFLHINRVST